MIDSTSRYRRRLSYKVALLVTSAGITSQVTVAHDVVPSTLPPAAVVMEFPGHESAEVTFRASASTQSASSDEYANLVRGARAGNADAAFNVGNMMVTCAVLRGVPLSGDNIVFVAPKPPPADDPRANPKARAFCAERTAEEIAAAVSWLEAAAAAGNLEAQRRLDLLYRKGSEEHLDVLHAMWQQGSVRGLEQLGKLYPLISTRSGPDSDEAVKSLAAAWLHVRLTEAAFAQQADSNAFVVALRKSLATRFDTAGPASRARAIATARQMLTQNTNCCSLP